MMERRHQFTSHNAPLNLIPGAACVAPFAPQPSQRCLNGGHGVTRPIRKFVGGKCNFKFIAFVSICGGTFFLSSADSQKSSFCAS